MSRRLPPNQVANPFVGYVQIAPDDTVTIYSSQMDMGQGIYHGIATLVQEELDADWAKVSVVGGFGNTALYGNLPFGGKIQMTGGSSGTASSWERYRRAGATARAMLIAAAAESWNVPIGEIKAQNGICKPRFRQVGNIWRIGGQRRERPGSRQCHPEGAERLEIHRQRDAAALRFGRKSNGRQQYTIDLREPGMLTAVMIYPPLFGATLKSFDASKAKAMKGVVDVVATPRGVAVVATGMWEAMKAREAVTVDWEDDKAEKRSSARDRCRIPCCR